MKLKFNSECLTIFAHTVLVAGAFIFTTAAMQDPDVYVKEKLETLSSSITNATASELDEIEKAVNAAADFFKEPAYEPGLALIGDSTNPAENTLRKKIADRRTVTQSATQPVTGAVTQPVGQVVTEPVTQTPDINTTIVSHINNILKGTSIKIGTKTYTTKAFKDKVNALKVLATIYKKASGITASTQDAFAAAIMKVGGTYIYTNVKNINALYAKVKTKNKTEKNKIKKFIKTAKKSLVHFGNYKSMLSVAYNSKLLGGTKKTGHKSFVLKVLIPYTNRLIALEKVK